MTIPVGPAQSALDNQFDVDRRAWRTKYILLDHANYQIYAQEVGTFCHEAFLFAPMPQFDICLAHLPQFCGKGLLVAVAALLIQASTFEVFTVDTGNQSFEEWFTDSSIL